MANQCQERVREVRKLYDSGKYSAAVQSIVAAEKDGWGSVDLLVLKAKALQLLNDGGPLSEVAACFDTAIRLDPSHIRARLEYAWFLFNVMDQPDRAEVQFLRCIELLKQQNTEAILGVMKCKQERGPGEPLESFFKQLCSTLIDSTEIQEALNR